MLLLLRMLGILVVCGSGARLGSQVAALPLADWGEAVRLRHLYAAKHGLYLHISKDGKVGGSREQSAHSLVEIRTVETGCVVIRGVASSRYLCMEPNGKLYGSHIYVKDDCSFLEHIQPNGYNVYISGKYGTLLSLGGGKNRPPSASSQFLPIGNTLLQKTTDYNFREGHPSLDPERDPHLGLPPDSMESFGKISQIFIQSPSFNKR
ncbi:fibroblast growth factor 19 [Hoplias malabaricus]|uniref:fibroblast growth factor 19 n=1 Tax=Hoplias malabaricus TaxID=27720 RepID=UPI00346323AB